MKSELVTVYLTDEEAGQFILFQKHRAMIGLLQSIDVFSLKSGSVEIHFDDMGRVKHLEKHQHYKT